MVSLGIPDPLFNLRSPSLKIIFSSPPPPPPLNLGTLLNLNFLSPTFPFVYLPAPASTTRIPGPTNIRNKLQTTRPVM